MLLKLGRSDFILVERKESLIVPRINRPKKTRPNRPISPKHLKQLHDATDTTREKLLLHFSLDTAMRVSDLVRATWPKVNFHDLTYHYISQKTHEDVYIPLSLRTIELLRKYKKIQQPKDERIFPVTTQRIRQILKKIKSRTNITRKITPHDFCTTAISNLAKNKVPIKAIADITGRHPRTVANYYEKFDIDELREFKKGTALEEIIKDVKG